MNQGEIDRYKHLLVNPIWMNGEETEFLMLSSRLLAEVEAGRGVIAAADRVFDELYGKMPDGVSVAIGEWRDRARRFLGETDGGDAPVSGAVSASAPVDCSPSPWRRMTPEEYARDFASFPPHRAEVVMAVKGEPASAEVSVFIVSSNAEVSG